MLSIRQAVELLEDEGYTMEDAHDSVNPGICTSCGAIVDAIEPDVSDGLCECGLNKVHSLTMLYLFGY